MNKIKVAASILAADFSKLADEIKKCNESGIDMIHIDVMDGHFVPNITVGPVIIKSIRPLTKLPISAHLMIENPWSYIEDFARAGSDIINLHAENYGRLRPASAGLGKFPKEIDSINADKALWDIKKIKSLGKKAAMTLNPGSPLCIQDLLSELDMVLIMSVNPGFAGQKFMPSVLAKLKNLRKIYDKDIEIDGGINRDTAKDAVLAGANILATASYFFGSKHPLQAVGALKSL